MTRYSKDVEKGKWVKSVPVLESTPGLRFSKVRFKSKRPFEKDWPRRPYTYREIHKHRKNCINYGVLCGYGGLVVVDADGIELIRFVERVLKPTFSVRTGSGGLHYYYLCRGLKKRISLELGGRHQGEIQTWGQQVVGPESLHPNGRRYRIASHVHIATVAKSELLRTLRPFVKTPSSVYELRHPIIQGNDNRRMLAFEDVICLEKFRRASNGEIYGPNPWHGSTTGRNFWINLEKNVGYCFRHHTGVSVVKALALNYGLLVDCRDEVAREVARQVFERSGFSASASKRKV